jgi:hypothetical protein
MKLKHNAGSKTEREKLAKTLALSYQNGGADAVPPIEQLEINLPPGIIEKAAKSLGVQLPKDISSSQKTENKQQLN